MRAAKITNSNVCQTLAHRNGRALSRAAAILPDSNYYEMKRGISSDI